jgi:hypothetical protein
VLAAFAMNANVGEDAIDFNINRLKVWPKADDDFQ